MSETTTPPAAPENEYDLPDRAPTNRPAVARKTVYTAGKAGKPTENEFQYLADGEVSTGMALIEGIRINRIAARPQDVGGVDRIVVSVGMMFDNEEIGTIDGENYTPHAMYTEPQYGKWQRRDKRPHRIQASQWVQPENFEKLRAWVNAMKRNFGWRIIPNPPQSDTRATRDLFIAIAPNSDDENQAGTLCDAIEVSVNPSYEDGFVDFITALNQQQERWDFAMGLRNEKQQQAALAEVARNLHFLGGTYTDTNGVVWPRSTDIGCYWIGGEEYRLYHPKGDDELGEDIFAGLRTGGDADVELGVLPGTPAPDAGEFDLPDPDSLGSAADRF